MSIAALACQCLDELKSTPDDHGINHDSRVKFSVHDELGRFRVWCGNLSAHRPAGGRSLEYRLRDSPNLYAEVLRLLTDLLETIRRLDRDELALDDYEDNSADSEDSSEGSDSLDYEFDEAAVRQAHPTQDIHDIINLLYRFSMTLRNPAGHGRILEGASSVSGLFTAYDTERVGWRYPHAEQYLKERLGRAMAMRRQYFKYREEHRLKLAVGLFDEVVQGPLSTTAPQSTAAPQSTLASSLPRQSHRLSLGSDTTSVYSTTSFAATESELSNLRPPPIPEAGAHGEPFECPICYSIQCFQTSEEWKKHVFEDITPYMCTVQDCNTRHTLFSRRRHWQRHQNKVHHRVWVCPLGCSGMYRNPDALQEHLSKNHEHGANATALRRILDSSTKHAEHLATLECPLCKKLNPSVNEWFKHVGRHMEQLALSCLPSHILAVDQDEEDAVDEKSQAEGIGRDENRDAGNQNITAGQESLNCHICDVRFLTLLDLNNHFPWHGTNAFQPHDQPHECSSCVKRFPSREILMHHLRIHHPSDPRYFCLYPQCDLNPWGFHRLDVLEAHIRNTHFASPAVPSFSPDKTGTKDPVDVPRANQYEKQLAEYASMNEALLKRINVLENVISDGAHDQDRTITSGQQGFERDATRSQSNVEELHEQSFGTNEAIVLRNLGSFDRVVETDTHTDAARSATRAEEPRASSSQHEYERRILELEAEVAKGKIRELESRIARSTLQAEDEQKRPIRFKDAVGRKFSFPWHIVKTWRGMESLIKQAFLHVDSLEEYVNSGKYDILGPDGEIILPQVWESTVQPDWQVTMLMWPIEGHPIFDPNDKTNRPASDIPKNIIQPPPDPFEHLMSEPLFALGNEANLVADSDQMDQKRKMEKRQRKKRTANNANHANEPPVGFFIDKRSTRSRQALEADVSGDEDAGSDIDLSSRPKLGLASLFGLGLKERTSRRLSRNQKEL